MNCVNKKIIIFGATSSIAQEIAKLFVDQSNDVFLVARNFERLTYLVDDLSIRGDTKVSYECCDLNNLDSHQEIIEKAINLLGHIDIILIAHGVLPKQDNCENDFDYAIESINTNLISNISILTIMANYFEKRKQGCIAVISSVAGDRGRQSNYTYGMCKGGLNIYLQGLRCRLNKSNIQVLTIKPGFVDTPMTKDFKKGLLWSKPDKVAKKIMKSIEKKCNEVYVPYFWYYIMAIIKLIPERIFCKLKL